MSKFMASLVPLGKPLERYLPQVGKASPPRGISPDRRSVDSGGFSLCSNAPRAVWCSHGSSQFPLSAFQQYGNPHNTSCHEMTCFGHVLGTFFFILLLALCSHKKVITNTCMGKTVSGTVSGWHLFFFVLIRHIFIFYRDMSFLSLRCTDLIKEVGSYLLAAFNYAVKKLLEVPGTSTILISVTKNKNTKEGQNLHI